MDGRIYLFVLDDAHIDLTRGPRVKEALHRFFERDFGANDMAAVVYTGGRAIDGQDFTNNPRLLLAAVDKFMGRKLRSPTLERLDEYNRQRTAGTRNAGDAVNDPAAFERAQKARGMLDSLRRFRISWRGFTAGEKRWCSSAKGSITTSTICSTTTPRRPTSFRGHATPLPRRRAPT
jgi:hypothetical protein